MVNVALVGYGYWGPNLARNLSLLSSCRLVACCDSDELRLEAAKQAYPWIQVTTRYEDLLEDQDVQALVIATPAQSHFQLAKKALLSGKHILVEKPLATSAVQAEELVALARSQDRTLMVGHTYEYHPAVVMMKDLVDRGEIGDVLYTYSTRVNFGRVQRDLSALWSIAPHDISTMLYLFSDVPIEVSARGASYLNQGVEDVVFLEMFFPTGVMAQVHASWLDPSKVRRMTVIGSKKMIIFDDIDSEAKLKIYDKEAVKIGGEPIFGEFHYRLRAGDIHCPLVDLTEPLRLECAHFVECVQQGKEPRTNGENGLRVVRVLEAAGRSLEKQGSAVPVLETAYAERKC